MTTLSRASLASRIDHPILQPDATRLVIQQLCAEARARALHGVCVNGSRVELACSLLEDTGVKVVGLVGFPLGASDADAKRYETDVATDHGAQEIQVVLNIGRLKDGDRRYVLRELRDVAEAADERPVNVMLETGLLTVEEQLIACELALDSGIHGVCAGTELLNAVGIEAVRRLRAALGPRFEVNAWGQIQDTADALTLIEAGATRLGTSNSEALLLGLAE